MVYVYDNIYIVYKTSSNYIFFQLFNDVKDTFLGSKIVSKDLVY